MDHHKERPVFTVFACKRHSPYVQQKRYRNTFHNTAWKSPETFFKNSTLYQSIMQLIKQSENKENFWTGASNAVF